MSIKRGYRREVTRYSTTTLEARGRIVVLNSWLRLRPCLRVGDDSSK